VFLFYYSTICLYFFIWLCFPSWYQSYRLTPVFNPMVLWIFRFLLSLCFRSKIVLCNFLFIFVLLFFQFFHASIISILDPSFFFFHHHCFLYFLMLLFFSHSFVYDFTHCIIRQGNMLYFLPLYPFFHGFVYDFTHCVILFWFLFYYFPCLFMLLLSLS
jgi:hypothetical protein